jgi:hypothetical protein
MTQFHELPHERRMAYRIAIDKAGGEVAAYQGVGVLVAIPRDEDRFHAAMEAAGLEYVSGSGFLFPLGSDAPAEHLRHDGRYPSSRGFWLYGLFAPRQS